ncbi:MAG: D-alanyl-D-alanine carboxypeptidase [Oscillospiraceae bacterium]|nr:D-alanyl-D-alanine carboxypeptidase [Oscillospiraceae bacterium]
MLSAKNIKITKKFKNLLATLLIFAFNSGFLVVFSAVQTAAFAPGFDIYSESAIMVNLDTDLTVFKQNEFKPVRPASTVKIMTALLALENIEDWNEFAVITNEMNYGFGKDRNYIGAGVADFEVGQTNLTYLDLLYALMIYSACDAANVLAYSVAGSVPEFVDMMNERATELGAKNTKFLNPHGLHDEGQYTTAWDLFLITKYAYETQELFAEVIRETEYLFPANSRSPNGLRVNNSNRLLNRTLDNGNPNPYFYEFARGVKTGSMPYYYEVADDSFTTGNFNLVSIASRNGFTYLTMTLNAPFYLPGSYSYENPPHHSVEDRVYYPYDDHTRLYNWAFTSLEYKTVLSVNDIVARLTVENGQAEDVQLRPALDFSTVLPSDLDETALLRTITPFDEVVQAPVVKGEVLGYVELMLNGEVIIGSRIDLVAAADVPLSTQEQAKRTFVDVISAGWFKACVAVIVALVLFVVVLRFINKSRSRRNSRSRGSRGMKR